MANLKPGWKRVKFGDMVSSMGATRKARGWTARGSGVDHYVGLEHLDSNSLKIRRWGSPDDVGENSDLRHFEPGDVILARRGIELRKVGLAEFRGVASGHALVFRAKPDVVLPEFLPFFIQSDAFMLRADRFSMGSLSHTVNLSALVNEEFALPPLEEQRRIASTFHAVLAAVQTACQATARTEQLRRALLFDCFRNRRGSKDHFPQHWTRTTIGSVGEIQIGIRKHPGSTDGPSMRPYLRVANVLDGFIDWTDVLRINVPPNDMERCALRHGDILVNKGNSMDLVGRAAMFTSLNQAEDKCYFQDHLLRFRADDTVLPGYALAYFQHLLYTLQFTRIAVASTSIATIPSDKFASLPFPLPPLAEQSAIVQRLESLQAARDHLNLRVSRGMDLARRLAPGEGTQQ